MKLVNLIEPKKQIPESKKKFSNSDLKALIIPIIIEQFLALLVGMMDTLMVSHVGETAVSGVSLVNQLNNVFIMVFSALASGGAVVASHYIGCEDKENGVLAASQLVMITLLISITCEIGILIFGKQVFTVLFGKVESEVLETGLTYLKISAWSFPFLAVYNGCAGLFRSMSKTKVLMNVSILMNLINVVGNAIGVFVLKAGVEGVAYPSLISRIFAAGVMLYLASNRKNMLYIKVKQIFMWRANMVVRIFNIAVPNGVENGLFQASKVALSSLIASFGTAQIAANGVAQSLWGISSLFCLAMGPAFITVIGRYMGAGDPDGADYYMKKLLKFTFLGAIIWNLSCLALTPLVLKLFSLSEETRHYVIIMVMIHNLLNGLICPVAFAMSNGMRASGDVKYTMLASIFSTVVCRVAFSVLFCVVFKMGVVGITIAMVCDWSIKAFLIMIRYRGGKWKEFTII